MPVRNVTTRFSVEGDNRVKQALASISDEGKRISGQYDATSSNVTHALNSISSTAVRVAGTIGAAFSVREIINYSDQFRALEGRLRVVTDSQTEFNQAMQGLNDVALRARAPLEGTAQLYGRIALNAGEVIGEQQKILDVTEAVSTSIAITGESAATAMGAMLQFSQGLGTNFEAAGQEIRSIQEQAPRLARAIIDGLKETGKIADTANISLKKLAEDGVLTTISVTEALQAQLDELRADLNETSKTVGQAGTEIENAFLNYIGRSTAVTAGTSALAEGMSAVAENFELVADTALLATTIIGGRLVSGVVTATSAFIANEVAAAAAARQNALLAPAYLGVAGSATSAAGGVSLLNRSLGVTLGLFGGPLGLAITAAAAGIYLLSTRTSEAAEFQDRHNRVMREAEGRYYELKNASESRRKELEKENEELLKNTKLELANARAKLESLQAEQAKLAQAGYDPLNTGRDFAGSQAGRISEEQLRNLDRMNVALDRVKKLSEEIAAIETPEKVFSPSAINNSAAAIGNLSKEQQKLIEKQKEYRAELGVAVQQMKALDAANKQSASAYEELKRSIDAENEARKQGFDITSQEGRSIVEQIKLREQLTDSIDATTKAREEARKKAEEDSKRLQEALAEPYKNALEGLQDEFTDFWEDIYSGGIDTAEDLGEGILRVLRRAAAEATTLQFIGPQGLSGLFLGAPGGTGTAATTGGFFDKGGSQIGNLLSLGKELIPSGSGSLFSSAINGFDDAASVVFGTAPSSFVGPFQPGTGTASNILNGTFSGAYGGAIAQLLGLGSGNPLLDTGAGLAGAALGNIIFPGVGGFIGSAAATALTGLFSSKSRPHPASNFGAGGFDAAGLLINPVSSSKHANNETADALTQLVNQTVQSLVLGGGFNFSGINSFQGGVDDGTGFFSLGDFKRFDSNTFTFRPDDEADAARALNEVLIEMARRTNDASGAIADEFLPALDRIDATASTALNDLAVLGGFDELVYGAKQAEVSLGAVGLQFTAAREAWERLGLSVEQGSAGFARNFNQDILSQIIGRVNPGAAREIAIRSEFGQLIKDAQLFGGNVEAIEILRDLTIAQEAGNQELAAIRQDAQRQANELVSQFSRLSSAFGSILYDTSLGNFSGLAPRERLGEFESRLRELAPLVALGNIDAGTEAAELLPEFLKLSSEINGFNTDFAEDRELARQIAESGKLVADRQLEIQKDILSELQEQTGILGTGQDKLLAQIEGLLSPEQLRATQVGRYIGALGANEFALNGLLGGRLSADPALRELYISLYNSSQKFAGGGVVTGGVPGVDSVLTLSQQGERYLSVDQSAMLETIYRGTVGANDNVASEVKGLRNDIRRLTDVLVAHGQVNVEAIDRVVEGIDELSSSPRLRRQVV